MPMVFKPTPAAREGIKPGEMSFSLVGGMVLLGISQTRQKMQTGSRTIPVMRCVFRTGLYAPRLMRTRPHKRTAPNNIAGAYLMASRTFSRLLVVSAASLVKSLPAT